MPGGKRRTERHTDAGLSRLYHRRLIDAGMASELVEYPHTIHAFLSFAAELDVAWEALDRIAARLRGRLGSSEARLHHVTLPYAPGAQDQVQQFYGGLLGLKELPIPEAAADRRSCGSPLGPETCT